MCGVNLLTGYNYEKVHPDALSRFRFFDLACVWRIMLINQLFVA